MMESTYKRWLTIYIKKYCVDNNINISYLSKIGNSCYYNFNGNYKDIDNLNVHIKELENEKKWNGIL